MLSRASSTSVTSEELKQEAKLDKNGDGAVTQDEVDSITMNKDEVSSGPSFCRPSRGPLVRRDRSALWAATRVTTALGSLRTSRGAGAGGAEQLEPGVWGTSSCFRVWSGVTACTGDRGGVRQCGPRLCSSDACGMYSGYRAGGSSRGQTSPCIMFGVAARSPVGIRMVGSYLCPGLAINRSTIAALRVSRAAV